jgi:hypothetical protein
MSKTLIAVIDDGVNPLYFHNRPLIYDIEISTTLRIRKVHKHSPHFLTHGTFCAGIIKKNAPQADICSIKVLNKNHRGSVYQTVKALEWCINNNIRLINMSIGTVNPKDFASINKIVDKVCDSGILIVAATSNNNKITYPACLEKVIGVRCCPDKTLRDQEYYYNFEASRGIEIICNGVHFLKGPNNQTYFVGPSNSFATSLMCSIIYGIIENNSNASITDIKEKLKNKARS